MLCDCVFAYVVKNHYYILLWTGQIKDYAKTVSVAKAFFLEENSPSVLNKPLVLSINFKQIPGFLHQFSITFKQATSFLTNSPSIFNEPLVFSTSFKQILGFLYQFYINFKQISGFLHQFSISLKQTTSFIHQF